MSPTSRPLAFIICLATARLTPAGPALPTLVKADTHLLVVGEAHSCAESSSDELASLGPLAQLGFKQLAMEIPRDRQPALDRFVSSKRSLDWLSRALWEMPFDGLPPTYRQKLKILGWCRDHGIRASAVDAPPDLWWRIGTEEAFAGNLAVPVPEGDEIVRKLGSCPSVDRGNAVTQFWVDYVDSRTRAMADAVRILLKDGKVILICGEAHAAPRAIATRLGTVCPVLSGPFADEGLTA